MDDSDVFFTQTIVGPPFTVLMGRRQTKTSRSPEGLELDLATGESRLTRLWREWLVLSHANDPAGQTRRRPGRVRRLMERHALWIALLGLTSFASSLIVWGLTAWN
jgi:hypothetical protein